MAACRGQVDCLQVIFRLPLLRCGCVSNFAAAFGHLACLRLAHEHGDVLNQYAAQAAAREGISIFLIELHLYLSLSKLNGLPKAFVGAY
jgi:hypothetical protein